VVRFTSDGNQVSAFGSNGLFKLGISGTDRTVVALDNGKMVVAAERTISSNSEVFHSFPSMLTAP
jgi:hypothetical protein